MQVIVLSLAYRCRQRLSRWLYQRWPALAGNGRSALSPAQPLPAIKAKILLAVLYCVPSIKYCSMKTIINILWETGCRVQVFGWSSIAQSVCQRAFSLLAIWCLGPRVQILHSAEEHNLFPFDLNIACLCQSIEINNNKYVYRQSQVRKSTDSGVKWAECSLIIGMGCRVQVFARSSIAQSVCQRAFSLLWIWCLGPRVQILHSAEEHNLSPFDLNIACLCQSIEINNNK